VDKLLIRTVQLSTASCGRSKAKLAVRGCPCKAREVLAKIGGRTVLLDGTATRKANFGRRRKTERARMCVVCRVFRGDELFALINIIRL